MTAITTRLPECTIEYDTRTQGRTTKRFAADAANEAKAFYAKQDKAGKNPKLVGDATPATEAAAPAADKAPPAPVAATTAPTAAGKRRAKAQPETVPTAATTPKVPGISVGTKGRYFYAAQIIKRRGLEAGVDKAMIEELGRLYGKPNAVEDRIALANTHGALRGWDAAE